MYLKPDLTKSGGLRWEWPYFIISVYLNPDQTKRGGLWWEWPYFIISVYLKPDLTKRGGLWWEWPYFTISVYLKSVLIKGVASGGSGPILISQCIWNLFWQKGWPLVGVDLFYYLSVSEICSDKRGGLWWEWTYKRGTTVFYNLNAMWTDIKHISIKFSIFKYINNFLRRIFD